MIAVRLMGGLGNQLFQYAMGRALSLRNHSELRLHQSFVGDPTKRVYSLGHFTVQDTVLTPTELAWFELFNYKPEGRAEVRWKRKCAHLFRKEWPYVFEKQFSVEPALFTRRHAYLFGYWQSEQYFKDIEDTLRQDLTLSAPLTPYYAQLAERIRRTTAVAIHVRRGDLVTNPNVLLALVPQTYYERCVREILEQVPNAEFFIFSDDIAWCREHLHISAPVTYVDNPRVLDYEELVVMSECKHFIIANSTFSWWAAWLSTNQHKLVYAPLSYWFKKPIDTSDLIPPTWISL